MHGRHIWLHVICTPICICCQHMSLTHAASRSASHGSDSKHVYIYTCAQAHFGFHLSWMCLCSGKKKSWFFPRSRPASHYCFWKCGSQSGNGSWRIGKKIFMNGSAYFGMSQLCLQHMNDQIINCTNFIELSPSREAACRSATQELTFYGTRRFITAFTWFLHWPLSWARSIQSIPPQTISVGSILILSAHLRLGLHSGLCPSGFLPISYMHSSSPHSSYMPFPSHPLWLDHSNYTWRRVIIKCTM
jgi:hypothetical protein